MLFGIFQACSQQRLLSQKYSEINFNTLTVRQSNGLYIFVLSSAKYKVLKTSHRGNPKNKIKR